MDKKLETYQEVIKRILNEYVVLLRRANQPGVESMTVFDDTSGHYILHTIGWAARKHVWNTTIYVRLHQGKFYIEIDWTEEGVATELLAAGVPNDDIVLAFHHPSVRPHTEFAEA